MFYCTCFEIYYPRIYWDAGPSIALVLQTTEIYYTSIVVHVLKSVYSGSRGVNDPHAVTHTGPAWPSLSGGHAPHTRKKTPMYHVLEGDSVRSTHSSLSSAQTYAQKLIAETATKPVGVRFITDTAGSKVSVAVATGQPGRRSTGWTYAACNRDFGDRPDRAKHKRYSWADSHLNNEAQSIALAAIYGYVSGGAR